MLKIPVSHDFAYHTFSKYENPIDQANNNTNFGDNEFRNQGNNVSSQKNQIDEQSKKNQDAHNYAIIVKPDASSSDNNNNDSSYFSQQNRGSPKNSNIFLNKKINDMSPIEKTPSSSNFSNKSYVDLINESSKQIEKINQMLEEHKKKKMALKNATSKFSTIVSPVNANDNQANEINGKIHKPQELSYLLNSNHLEYKNVGKSTNDDYPVKYSNEDLNKIEPKMPVNNKIMLETVSKIDTLNTNKNDEYAIKPNLQSISSVRNHVNTNNHFEFESEKLWPKTCRVAYNQQNSSKETFKSSNLSQEEKKGRETVKSPQTVTISQSLKLRVDIAAKEKNKSSSVMPTINSLKSPNEQIVNESSDGSFPKNKDNTKIYKQKANNNSLPKDTPYSVNNANISQKEKEKEDLKNRLLDKSQAKCETPSNDHKLISLQETKQSNQKNSQTPKVINIYAQNQEPNSISPIEHKIQSAKHFLVEPNTPFSPNSLYNEATKDHGTLSPNFKSLSTKKSPISSKDRMNSLSGKNKESSIDFDEKGISPGDHLINNHKIENDMPKSSSPSHFYVKIVESSISKADTTQLVRSAEGKNFSIFSKKQPNNDGYDHGNEQNSKDMSLESNIHTQKEVNRNSPKKNYEIDRKSVRRSESLEQKRLEIMETNLKYIKDEKYLERGRLANHLEQKVSRAKTTSFSRERIEFMGPKQYIEYIAQNAQKRKSDLQPEEKFESKSKNDAKKWFKSIGKKNNITRDTPQEHNEGHKFKYISRMKDQSASNTNDKQQLFSIYSLYYGKHEAKQSYDSLALSARIRKEYFDKDKEKDMSKKTFDEKYYNRGQSADEKSNEIKPESNSKRIRPNLMIDPHALDQDDSHSKRSTINSYSLLSKKHNNNDEFNNSISPSRVLLLNTKEDQKMTETQNFKSKLGKKSLKKDLLCMSSDDEENHKSYIKLFEAKKNFATQRHKNTSFK